MFLRQFKSSVQFEIADCFFVRGRKRETNFDMQTGKVLTFKRSRS